MNASQFYADPADREHLVSGFAPGGGVVDREVRFRRKDGELVWVSMTFLEYEDEGQPFFEAVMLDITDRKATSARIEELNAALARQNQDLAAANQELDAFSYSISHDLRAPLRAMQGFSEALLEDYGERLDATGHDYAQRIVAASRQMDTLIQDLLAYSRLVRAEVSLDPVSLETVVDEVVRPLEMEVKERGGEIIVERPLGRVLAHRTVLGQIVTNLLTNALKFTRPDTPPRVRVRSERADGRVRLWVEDNGIGIAAEHRERIFRAFERLHGDPAVSGHRASASPSCRRGPRGSGARPASSPSRARAAGSGSTWRKRRPRRHERAARTRSCSSRTRRTTPCSSSAPSARPTWPTRSSSSATGRRRWPT